MYTKQDYLNAIVLSPTQYMTLVEPKFEGQTAMDEEGNCSVYWSSEGKLYVRHMNILD